MENHYYFANAIKCQHYDLLDKLLLLPVSERLMTPLHRSNCKKTCLGESKNSEISHCSQQRKAMYVKSAKVIKNI